MVMDAGWCWESTWKLCSWDLASGVGGAIWVLRMDIMVMLMPVMEFIHWTLLRTVLGISTL